MNECHAIFGVAFNLQPVNLRSAYRINNRPGVRYYDLGCTTLLLKGFEPSVTWNSTLVPAEE